MGTNVGSIDRVLRFLLAGGLFYAGLDVYANSTLGTGLMLAALIPLLTGLVGMCPLYRLLGIRTCSIKNLPQDQ